MRLLFGQVDSSSLGLFRVVFGILMVFQALELKPVPSDTYRPTYELIGFLTAGPSDPTACLVIMIIAACAIAAGIATRIFAALYGVIFTYAFLLDVSQYNNHYYLIALLCLLFTCTRTERFLAVSQRWVPNQSTVAAWNLRIFQFQFATAYIYGGIAKLNADWLRAEPIRQWIRVSPGMFPESLVWTEWFPFLIAYGGVFYDISIPFLLLSRRLRAVGILLSLFFHLSNVFFFNIGVFPWLAMGALVLFLEPSTPRRLFCRFLKTRTAGQPVKEISNTAISDSVPMKMGMTAVLLLYVSIQLLVPMRHVSCRGWTEWNEVGKNFSWRMMLTNKRAVVEMMVFDAESRKGVVVDQSGITADFNAICDFTEVNGSLTFVPSKLLTGNHMHGGNGVWGNPKLLWQYAQMVASDAKSKGMRSPGVYAKAVYSLNGRPFQFAVDPNVDLAAASCPAIGTPSWVLPANLASPPGDYPSSYREMFERAHRVIISGISTAKSGSNSPEAGPR